MSGIRKKIVFLPYDFDTALGIDNYGRLRFDYHLEDIDTVNGEKVYAGQDSVLWKNVRAAFADELASMWKTLRSGNDPALSYNKVEAMFEAHQDKWPEALANEDYWYKYILPLIQNNENRLEMCLGLKTEQRKWWLYNRFKYIDSKYNAGDASADSVSMRTYYEPAGSETYGITVTPYADIYATVMYGVSKSSVRSPRNQAVLVPCALSHLEFTDTYIYSASQIKSFGDLSIFRPDAVEFSRATHIQELKLGDSSNSYTNPNLKALSLGNNVLLKKIDCRNCVNMGTGSQKTVDLSGCSNIEEVYFDGTAIGSVTLPNGGFLKKLHLPSTITNLTVLNQKNITEFICPGFTNVTTFRIENCSSAINTKSIVQAIPAATRLRLVGFYWECTDADEIEDLLDIFDSMRGLDEQGNTISIADGGCRTSISGTIHTDSLTGAQIASYQARYPYLSVVADHTTSYRRFMAADNTTVYQTVTCIDGVAQSAAPSVPSKSSTAQYNYTGVGWNTSQNQSTANYDHSAVTLGDMTYYPAYTASVRSYTITFARASDDGGGTLQTRTLQYGTMASYTGSTPTTTKGSATDYPFRGWNPALATVTGNATYTAVFGSPSVIDFDGAYGVEWNYANTSPQLTRKGLAESFTDPDPDNSTSPFDNIAPWKDMKRYNVVNGEVVPFTSYSEDTVVYIPEFYYLSGKDTGSSKWGWAISPTPKDGYTKHPGSGRYIGRYHTTGSTSGVFTKTGSTPLVNQTRASFRTLSKAKGTGWEMLDLATWSAIQMLYLVEFAHFDSQTKLGTGWNTGSIGTVGGTDSATYHTVKASGAHNQYRWVEDPFSNVYDWVDGFMAENKAVYVGTDSSAYDDSITGLDATGITLPSSNEIRNFGFSNVAPWAFIPDQSVSNSSMNTYVCDRVNSNSGSCVLCVGGYYGSGSSYGLFYFNANYLASYTYSGIGSRLLFK